MDGRATEGRSDEVTLELIGSWPLRGLGVTPSALMFSASDSISQVIVGVTPVTFAVFYLLKLNHSFLPHKGKGLYQDGTHWHVPANPRNHQRLA